MSNAAISTNLYKDNPATFIEEDEIDLNELFSKIWRRRRFIASFVLISVLLVLGISALVYLIKPPVKHYGISVRFNFPSSAQARYPAGQRFSNNDLITSVVLKQVYDINDIQSQGIDFASFSSAFTVAPYAANGQFIQKKYEKLLASKKLSRTDIEALEKQYENEMKAAQTGFAQISYVDNQHLGLSPVIIAKVLNDIPRVWSQVSIRDLGVLDLKVPGKQFYQPELIEQYEYLQAVQYMLDSVNRFQKILDVLQKDSMGGFVRDPQTGLVVSDLLSRLQSLKQFDLVPVYSVIANLGLVKNREQARLYLLNEIELIQDQSAELKQKIRVYKEAMLAYEMHGKDTANNAAATTASSGMVQYGDGFLSSIVGMVEEKKETEYRQALLNKQIALSMELQELNTKQEKLKRALSILNTNKPGATDAEATYGKKISHINKELEALINAYQRILELRNAHVLGKSSDLYELASLDMTVSSDMKSKLKTTLILAVVVAFIALMLAVVIALIRQDKAHPGSA